MKRSLGGQASRRYLVLRRMTVGRLFRIKPDDRGPVSRSRVTTLQQDKELEKNKADNVVAMIQQGFNIPTPMIPSSSATPNEQQPDILKARNSISRDISLLSNHRNAVTPKEIIKSKRTNCNQSHSPSPKCTRITEGQKLVNSIYAGAEKLRLSYEGKTEPTEQAVKQLVELYGDNSRLLSGELTLLQNDCKIPIFLSLNWDIQKL